MFPAFRRAQAQALAAWIDYHGRTWRNAMLGAWVGAVRAPGAILSLEKTHGAAWLAVIPNPSTLHLPKPYNPTN